MKTTGIFIIFIIAASCLVLLKLIIVGIKALSNHIDGNHEKQVIKAQSLRHPGVIDYYREEFYVKPQSASLYKEATENLKIPSDAIIISCINVNSFIMRATNYFWVEQGTINFFPQESVLEDYDAIELNKIKLFTCDRNSLISYKAVREENYTEMVINLGEIKATLYLKYGDYESLHLYLNTINEA